MEKNGAVFETAFGWMGLVRGPAGIQRIFLPVPERESIRGEMRRRFPSFRENRDSFNNEIAQIEEYFAGERKTFRFLLDFSGATPFQRSVYEILLRIPFGEVRSYAWLAREIGNPKALRAVGHANGKNKWPLVVPCHRVVGSRGYLTGFSAAGGLELKARLLRHEGVPLEGAQVKEFGGSQGRLAF
jgi:methylated-DNA-[protein]-cysteine S-methyltransferase